MGSSRSAFWVSPLEPDEATFRRWLDEVGDALVEHLSRLPELPAADVEGFEERLDELVEPLPESGADAAELLRGVLDRYVEKSFLTPGPGYLAYIPGGGLLTAPLADLFAGVVNRYVGVFAAAPLLARLEVTAVDWLRELLALPRGFRGVLTSGGSMANLIALVCGRHDRLGERFEDGVVYVSDQAHHSVERAARVVGFRRDQVRSIPTGEDLRLPPEAVRRAAAADRAGGLRPAVLVASAGTTNTGVVDDLQALAAVAREEGLWFHVDAAYGGFFRATRRGRERLAGLERADSVTVDPHKGMFLPYGTGCVLVRDLDALRAPFRSETDYLPPLQDDPRAQDFCETSPELSRDFRGLRVWLSLKTFGAEAFRAALDEKLDLARHAYERLAALPFFEPLAEPDLSLVAFRLRREGADPAAEDRRNRELLERVLARKRVWMSGARVKGRFVNRLCVLSFRTHREHVDEALDALEEEGRRLATG